MTSSPRYGLGARLSSARPVRVELGHERSAVGEHHEATNTWQEAYSICISHPRRSPLSRAQTHRDRSEGR